MSLSDAGEGKLKTSNDEKRAKKQLEKGCTATFAHGLF